MLVIAVIGFEDQSVASQKLRKENVSRRQVSEYNIAKS